MPAAAQPRTTTRSGAPRDLYRPRARCRAPSWAGPLRCHFLAAGSRRRRAAAAHGRLGAGRPRRRSRWRLAQGRSQHLDLQLEVREAAGPPPIPRAILAFGARRMAAASSPPACRAGGARLDRPRPARLKHSRAHALPPQASLREAALAAGPAMSHLDVGERPVGRGQRRHDPCHGRAELVAGAPPEQRRRDDARGQGALVGGAQALDGVVIARVGTLAEPVRATIRGRVQVDLDGRQLPLEQASRVHGASLAQERVQLVNGGLRGRALHPIVAQVQGAERVVALLEREPQRGHAAVRDVVAAQVDGPEPVVCRQRPGQAVRRAIAEPVHAEVDGENARHRHAVGVRAGELVLGGVRTADAAQRVVPAAVAAAGGVVAQHLAQRVAGRVIQIALREHEVLHAGVGAESRGQGSKTVVAKRGPAAREEAQRRGSAETAAELATCRDMELDAAELQPNQATRRAFQPFPEGMREGEAVPLCVDQGLRVRPRGAATRAIPSR
mmetsp:Transcript_3411/g.8434  ORF Transcript_3411/g.8434 Transcript_3411/m.8434 type:complete len:499 (-) Transcript_3411:169-1665(-)